MRGNRRHSSQAIDSPIPEPFVPCPVRTKKANLDCEREIKYAFSLPQADPQYPLHYFGETSCIHTIQGPQGKDCLAQAIPPDHDKLGADAISLARSDGRTISVPS